MTRSQGPARTIARRTVVTTLGGAGLAAALTACGDSEDGGQSAQEQPPQQPTGGTASATASAEAGADAGGGAGTGKVIAKTSEIPEGGGKVIGDVVVTQPTAGEFRAFSSKCTHQGCAVKGIANGVINCPCHNSEFSVTDGSVKKGPATTALPPASITVAGDSITLA
ncbi:Rieske (2Fe-2S) protein [Streptomyces sp. NPDC052236]|uniref:Rieske (2Fe-2S) protein n=1 Tax=Streptomyces sp. NPDC052236 TaxID=3365686 RepID=UPI0037D68320